MREALGLVEVKGLSTAILVADNMVKTANIRIINIENTKGLGYMTIKAVGDVGAINAAVSSGKQIAIANDVFISSKVIPRPSDFVETIFCQPPISKDTSLKTETKKRAYSKKSNNGKSSLDKGKEKAIVKVQEKKSLVKIEEKKTLVKEEKVPHEEIKNVEKEDKKDKE